MFNKDPSDNNEIIPTPDEQVELFASQVASDFNQIQQEKDLFTKLFEKEANDLN
jgi:hypothetical protein